MAKELSPLFCCATALRKAARRVSQLYDDALAPVGLTVGQFAILAELVRMTEGPPTQTELAHAMVMARSGLSHTLRPLERAGYISLSVGQRDRRSRQVIVTTSGRALYRKANRQWQKAQEHVMNILGKDFVIDLQNRAHLVAYDGRLSELPD